MAPRYQVTIPGLSYNVPNVDIGSGYASGITSAGKSIAGAISGVMGGINEKTGQYEPGILEQNQTATDMLNTMHASKIMTDDQYNSIAGKSLGAKQSMIGLYAGQYIADQAAARQLALEQGKGTVDVSTAHQKLLDTYHMIKTGGTAGAAATGVKQGETVLQPPPQPPPQPQPQAGQPAPGNMPLLPGTKFGQMQDPKTGQMVKGWMMPDGTFRPM
jgi:hypothetical protein